MKAKAKSTYKYARISSKKCQDIIGTIRRLTAEDAVNLLTYTPKKSARLILKTLNSAIANAENVLELDSSELIVSKAVVNQGPTFKRFKARARGSGDLVRKRTSHIHIELDILPEEDNADKGKKKAKEQKQKDNKKQQKSESKKESKTEQKPKPVISDKPKENTETHATRGLIYKKPPTDKDDLKRISGVAEVLEKKLNDFGIYTFEQIANWNKDNIDEFDKLLDFHGRIERDDWKKQAREFYEEKTKNKS